MQVIQIFQCLLKFLDSGPALVARYLPHTVILSVDSFLSLIIIPGRRGFLVPIGE
jgi:hypothetical protein